MLKCKICGEKENVSYDKEWQEYVCVNCKETLIKDITTCNSVHFPNYYVSTNLKTLLFTNLAIRKEFVVAREKFLRKDYGEINDYYATDNRFTFVKYNSATLDDFFLFVFDSQDLYILLESEFISIFHYQSPLFSHIF